VCVCVCGASSNVLNLCGLQLAVPQELVHLPEGLVPLLEDPDGAEAHLQGGGREHICNV